MIDFRQQCVIELRAIYHYDGLPISERRAVDRGTCVNQTISLERGGDDRESHISATLIV
jgi:hypothetical protein